MSQSPRVGGLVTPAGLCDNPHPMTDLTLIDAVVLLFVLFRIGRARNTTLGDSLHALIALLLIVALFLGFRMTNELRGLLSGVVDLMQGIPGLGSKLLIIIGAWYLMRLLRRRSGLWIEAAVPRQAHRRILPVIEGLRAALLAGFLVWLAEGWFDGPPQDTPLIVHGVRIGDAWVARMVSESTRPDGR